MGERCKLPPFELLPPNPPKMTYNSELITSENKINLPTISNVKTQNRKIVRKNTKLKTRLKNTIFKKMDSFVSAKLDNDQCYVCRLCSLDCLRSEILYAHLLIIIHEFSVAQHSKEDRFRFICRRCGKTWELNETCLDLNMHKCVQQKAAYINMTNKPKNFIKYGLPFVCLYCCAEPQIINTKTIKTNYPIHYRKKTKLPLRTYETANRFKSKLHLIIHILCRHSVKRVKGACGECFYQINKNPNYVKLNDINEEEFWLEKIIISDKNILPKLKNGDSLLSEGSISSESDNSRLDLSTNSLCEREGLSDLENHIDLKHLSQFEILYWLKYKFRESWIYTCPLCELLYENVSDLELYKKKINLTSNALLQAHVACYHAGATQFDSLLGNCQVCEKLNEIDHIGRLLPVNMKQFELKKKIKQATKHLIQAGHTKRLKENYDLALKQGRLQLDTTICEYDFSTTCFMCWQKFSSPSNLSNKYKILLAQCKLQTHLLTNHCTFRNLIEGTNDHIRPCGWCGKTMTDDNGKGDSSLTNCTQITGENAYDWFNKHENQHALELAKWWWKSNQKEDNDYINRI